MNTKLLPWLYLLALTILVIGCAPGEPTESTDTVEVQDTESIPIQAEIIPTEIIPTETPIPTDPIEIRTEEVTDDGCVVAVLNTESWSPLYAAYNATSDPFYQFHDNEDGFYFNIELYTMYGSGWTGQTGTFDVNCTTNGICVYLVPDDSNPFLATDGEIIISELGHEEGSLQKPAVFSLSNLTLVPVPGSGSEGCFFVDNVSLIIEN